LTGLASRMAPFTFSTALLAGGKSRRMGRDKALLTVGNSDLLLWQKQWQLLEKFRPKEMLWSGPPRPGTPYSARIVADDVESAGPLAGLSACLKVMHTDLLMVLAVDLPEMNPAVFLNLLGQSGKRRGAVYQHDGFFEPLAAIYPKILHALAEEHLTQGRFAMQDLILQAIRKEMMTVLPLPEAGLPYFKNVNAASDI
jgi:molybdopterin-guanine dinucleotide biosynthesis protein A